VVCGQRAQDVKSAVFYCINLSTVFKTNASAATKCKDYFFQTVKSRSYWHSGVEQTALGMAVLAQQNVHTNKLLSRAPYMMQRLHLNTSDILATEIVFVLVFNKRKVLLQQGHRNVTGR